MNVRSPYDSLWRKRLEALDAVWPDFLAGRPEALHKARVASRRIREALPVVAAGAPPAKVKKLRRKMRDLTRFLGPIRELDVELGMIEQEASGDNVPRSALSAVRREVASRRHALRARLKDEAPVHDLRKLLRKLEKVAKDKRQGSANKGHGIRSKGPGPKIDAEWRAALAMTLMRRAKRLKAALDEAGPLYAPERLHGVRVSVKKLRYAIEIAQDAGQPDAKSMVRILKREQERLGHLHDLQSLLKHVRAAESSPRAGDRIADLTAYADSLERDCRTLHAEFVEHRDALFGVIKEVRQHMAPALMTTRFRQARVIVSRRPQQRARPRAART